MDEVVRAFNFVIDQGWAYYWATSEWSAQQLEEAFRQSTSLQPYHTRSELFFQMLLTSSTCKDPSPSSVNISESNITRPL